ncbi:MAG: hypothetical protein COA79_24255 [Planctomycetota bacterium]|nr:MAG: hypothetical protein COA79_24255 [Planctomycetota bacterium]
MSAFSSPRLTSEQRADFFNVKSLLQSKQFKGKKDEELVLALYDYFTSQVNGTYHGWDMLESKGNPTTRGVVTDAVKLLNVYGFLICGQMANVLYRFYTEAGFKARQFSAPGHSLCEVFYAGKWHFLDFDMWTWFRNKEGEIASAYELTTDARELIYVSENKSNPCNLPDRNLDDYSNMFSNAVVEDGDIASTWPDHCAKAHTMDFYLRPGESIERSEVPQGRHHMPDRFVTLMKNYASKGVEAWKGYPEERYPPFRTYANGKLIYSPKLNSAYKDYSVGVWQSEGVELLETGLKSISGINSYASFRIQSPYVMCGKPTVKGDHVQSSDGVNLLIAGEGEIKLFINTSEKEWDCVAKFNGSFEESIDITESFDGRYEGVIKFELSEGACLKEFTFEAFLQMAAISLPQLVKGDNKLSVGSKDHYGLKTTPLHMPIDFREGKLLESRLHSSRNCLIKEERPGWLGLYQEDDQQSFDAVFKFEMPANRRAAWFYVYASIKEVPVGDPEKSASIYWSLNDQDWNLLTERNISQSHSNWDCCLDGEFKCEEATATIYFKLVSEKNACSFHCFSHLLEENLSDAKLIIEHEWKEEGEKKNFTHNGDSSEYSIHCDMVPSDHSFKMIHENELF